MKNSSNHFALFVEFFMNQNLRKFLNFSNTAIKIALLKY